MQYTQMTVAQLNEVLTTEKDKYNKILAKNLKIDISRGKPCKEQLDLVMDFFDILNSKSVIGNSDYRNYGILDGIPEMKKLFANMLEVKPENIIVGGASSLNLMYDTIQRALQFGIMGSVAWNKLPKVKFICLVPGYDRHFTICESFGIEMISVPLTSNGPDMDIVEELVKDESVKGIWCVPKYSNPTGITYSAEVVERLAKMKTAKDFRIFWDNAYCVHHLHDKQDKLANILDLCEKHSNPDRVYLFTSTSKITFPGAGVACIASSVANVKDILLRMQFQTIGYNKVNQFAHCLFLKDCENIDKIMKAQADIIRPKFEKVLNALIFAFGENSEIAKWSNPNGGYFISLDVLDGCASKVGKLCKEAGLVITPVGATFPYCVDDENKNIRIAPTFTNTNELDDALDILVCAVRYACIEKILETKNTNL